MIYKLREILSPYHEMSNLSPSSTGLKDTVWIEDAGKQRSTRHTKPRLKLGKPHQEVILEISSTAQILAGASNAKKNNYDVKQAQKWIKKNLEVLLQNWEGTIDTAEMLKVLKRLV